MKDPKYPLIHKMKDVETGEEASWPAPFRRGEGSSHVGVGGGGVTWGAVKIPEAEDRTGHSHPSRNNTYRIKNWGPIPPYSFIWVSIISCLLLQPMTGKSTDLCYICCSDDKSIYGSVCMTHHVSDHIEESGVDGEKDPWFSSIGRNDPGFSFIGQEGPWVFLYVYYFSLLSPNTDRKMWQVSGFPCNRENTRKLFGAPRTVCLINLVKRTESRDRLQSFW
jgi:hypothetical protein